MKHGPGPTGPIPWDQAPAGTTHAFRGPHCSDYWMQQIPKGWLFWSTLHRKWKVDGNPQPEYHIPRPVTECPYLEQPDDATHTQNGTDRLYKAGPNNHARLWSTYNGKPAWVCASNVKNEDLDDPTKFAPIIRDPLQSPTNSEVTFTMSEAQAQELALDKRPMKVVEVRFQRTEGAKTYHYYAPADAKSGDFAVVYANDSIVTNRDFPFTVVQIVNDEVIDTQRATKAILGTFNEDFAKHVQARIEHMARVKAKLQQKKKQFEESAFFEMLAKSDPEAASLLEELKSFNL